MLSLPSDANILCGLVYSPFGLYMGSGDLNFGPHVFHDKQALYPTEPFSQPSSAFSALSLHGSISSSLVLGYLPFLFYAMLFLASVIFSL